MSLSFGFSGAVRGAPDRTKFKRPEFMERSSGEKKGRRFPTLLTCSFTSPYALHVLVGEYELHSLSRYEAKPAFSECRVPNVATETPKLANRNDVNAFLCLFLSPSPSTNSEAKKQFGTRFWCHQLWRPLCAQIFCRQNVPPMWETST